MTIRYNGNINFLNVLSPFQYFVAPEVTRTGLNSFYVIFSLSASGAALIFSAWKYRSRKFLF